VEGGGQNHIDPQTAADDCQDGNSFAPRSPETHCCAHTTLHCTRTLVATGDEVVQIAVSKWLYGKCVWSAQHTDRPTAVSAPKMQGFQSLEVDPMRPARPMDWATTGKPIGIAATTRRRRMADGSGPHPDTSQNEPSRLEQFRFYGVGTCSKPS
jgi:hypothetical protein